MARRTRRPTGALLGLALVLLLLGSAAFAVDADVDADAAADQQLVDQEDYDASDIIAAALMVELETALEALEDARFQDHGSYEWRETVNGAIKALESLDEKYGYVTATVELGHVYLFGEFAPHNLTRAKGYFDKAAAVGDYQALLMLGVMHASGSFGLAKNTAKALTYYATSATDLTSDASLALGYRYLNGVDVQASCSIALRYYRQAAQVALDWLNAGHQDHDERAWLTDEDEIVSDKDLQDNFVFFQLAADYGDPGANAVMGNIYMNGLYGHRQNFDQARVHLEQAALNNIPEAFGQLGVMHYNGVGVAKDNKTARAYFEKGVALNDPTSLNGLAVMSILEGEHKAGFLLFKQAAELGDLEGIFRLASCYVEGVGTPVNFALALEFYLKAANHEHPRAYYYLGLMYDRGMGTPANCEVATKYYKLAAEEGPAISVSAAFDAYVRDDLHSALALYLVQAELGLVVAQHNAAHILEELSKQSSDDEEAARLRRHALTMWHRASKQGDVYALVMLGDRFFYGQTQPIPTNLWSAYFAERASSSEDKAVAAELYGDAALNHNSARALYNLAYMHQFGLGVDKSLGVAADLYTRAIDQNGDAAVPASLLLAYLRLQQLLARLGSLPGSMDDYLDLVLFVAVVLLISLVAWRQPRPARPGLNGPNGGGAAAQPLNL